MLVGSAVTLGLERIQTGHFGSLARQFTLRVIVLMPFAIAINIVLGQTVAAALKLPIYLDSIGTVLVGVLAGPIAGAATGALTNILWSYVVPPPFQYPPAAAFAVVAAVIGIAAGLAGRYGVMRPRTGRPTGQLVLAGVLVALIIIGLAWLASVGYQLIFDTELNPLPTTDNQLFLILGYIALLLVVAAVLGRVRAAVRATRPHRRLRGGDRRGDRHRGRAHQRPDRRRRVRRGHRRGHGLPGGRLPPGGGRHLRRHHRAGPDQRPDRQGHDLRHRVPHHGGHGRPAEGPLPAGRAAHRGAPEGAAAAAGATTPEGAG